MWRDWKEGVDMLRVSRWAVALLVPAAVLGLVTCTGETGPAGTQGAPGQTGDPGIPGDPGDPGQPAVDSGNIAGTVIDSTGAPLAGATVTTTPSTVTVQADGSGAFSLPGLAIGSYDVTATATDHIPGTVAGVGVTAGGTTQVSVTLNLGANVPGTISGTIHNLLSVPAGIAGAVVSVEGQAVSATTDAGGVFTLTDVAPGNVFLLVQAPAGYLDGGTRFSLPLGPDEAMTGIDIQLSSRPSDAATYVGTASCLGGCHSAEATAHQGSAHWRSITDDTSHMGNLATLWPTVGATIPTGISAPDPVTAATSVPVYLCQNTPGVYSMKFGGVSADCTAADGGTIVPVAGTYGGEGDGGVAPKLNFGKWKQRFLAKLTDVPVSAAWRNYPGGDVDRLILPVQITESGDGAPRYGGYKESAWYQQGRAFSRKCAGCHDTGLNIAYDAGNLITSYAYLDRNIGCEKCHGPGSEHVAASIADRPLTIINPAHLTAEGEKELCGQCHAADAGASKNPDGAFGYAYNAANVALIGNGQFVPGVYSLTDYIKGVDVTEDDGGGFEAWPDGIHGKTHRQQDPMFDKSKHNNNSSAKLSCATCHNVHSLYQGPEKFPVVRGGDDYVFVTPKVKDNDLCLGCHAGAAAFAAVSIDHVAAAHVAEGSTVEKNGVPMSFTAEEQFDARLAIAAAVSGHMEDKLSMGLVPYTPEDDALPTGRCTACHMPKTAKSGGYTTGLDGQGKSALVEGDQASHVFDIVWPYQSSVLKQSSGGSDTDIMPNSCGKCHASALLSGD